MSEKFNQILQALNEYHSSHGDEIVETLEDEEIFGSPKQSEMSLLRGLFRSHSTLRESHYEGLESEELLSSPPYVSSVENEEKIEQQEEEPLEYESLSLLVEDGRIFVKFNNEEIELSLTEAKDFYQTLGNAIQAIEVEQHPVATEEETFPDDVNLEGGEEMALDDQIIKIVASRIDLTNPRNYEKARKLYYKLLTEAEEDSGRSRIKRGSDGIVSRKTPSFKMRVPNRKGIADTAEGYNDGDSTTRSFTTARLRRQNLVRKVFTKKKS